MNFINYREKRNHGTQDFPFAFYYVDDTHPRYIMNEHWHPEYEIIRVISGRMDFMCDGNKITASKGDVLFVTGGCIHSASPFDCKYECMVFDIEYFTRSNNKENKEIFTRFYFADRVNLLLRGNSINIACDLIFCSNDKLNESDRLKIQAGVYLLFGTVIESGQYISNFASTGNRRKMKQFRKIVDYIHEHYEEDIDIDCLAQQVNLNRNYLCRFFKEICRRTPMQYINYYRVERACEKLITNDNSVTQVAVECGFNDISYFIKVFKKYKGMTPTEFIKNANNADI